MDDLTLLQQLRKEDRSAYKTLYSQYYRMIATYVGKNHGQDEDAQDLFQETIVALLKHLRKPDFNIKVKLGTYLHAIAKNIWRNKLRLKGITTTVVNERVIHNFADTIDEDLIEKKVYEEKHKIMKRQLARLGEECQKIILGFYYQRRKLKDLAVELSYTQDFIRVKKNRCMNNFRKKVQGDTALKNLPS